MYKVIFDTDIGDDIDDAFALGLVLKNPNFDTLAVTTVYKNTLARAKQAKALINLSGKDIPVYVGEVYPYSGNITGFEKDNGDLATILPCQYDSSMDGLEVEFNAAEAIVRLAKLHSKELIIFAVGAMTNVAKAIELDPSIVHDIKAVYQMGGWFTNFVPEWNIICDPEACDIVYKSGVSVYSVGLDVTLQCPLDGSLLENLRNSKDPITNQIFVWLDRWFDYFNFEKSVLHDPLAITALYEEKTLEFKPLYVKVVLEGEKRAAMLVSEEKVEDYSLINVACDVYKEKFFDIINKNFA